MGFYLVLALHWYVRKWVYEVVEKLVFDVEKRGESVVPMFKKMTILYILQMSFQFAFYFVRK